MQQYETESRGITEGIYADISYRLDNVEDWVDRLSKVPISAKMITGGEDCQPKYQPPVSQEMVPTMRKLATS